MTNMMLFTQRTTKSIDLYKVWSQLSNKLQKVTLLNEQDTFFILCCFHFLVVVIVITWSLFGYLLGTNW